MYRHRTMNQHFSTSYAGFSLVEIMVVLVIIGLLAGMVALNMGAFVETGKVKSATGSIATLESALEAYFAAKGKYPDESEGLAALSSGKTPFLKSLPADPWGNPFVYQKPGPEGKPYQILSYGADGIENGADENADISNWQLGQ